MINETVREISELLGAGVRGSGAGVHSFLVTKRSGSGAALFSRGLQRPGSGVAVSYMLPLGAGSEGPIFIFVPAPPPLLLTKANRAKGGQ
jgi:hypothetical protein